MNSLDNTYLCVHLHTYLWNGNEEVESEAENGSGQEYNEHSECSILKVSQLYLQEEAIEGDVDGVDWQEEGRKAFSIRGRWGGGVATTTRQFFSSSASATHEGHAPSITLHDTYTHNSYQQAVGISRHSGG